MNKMPASPLLCLRERAVGAFTTGALPPDVPEKLARVILDKRYQFVPVLDTDGNLLDINQAALDGGGMKLCENIGRPFWEAYWWTVSEQTQQQFKEAIAQAARGQFVRY